MLASKLRSGGGSNSGSSEGQLAACEGSGGSFSSLPTCAGGGGGGEARVADAAELLEAAEALCSFRRSTADALCRGEELRGLLKGLAEVSGSLQSSCLLDVEREGGREVLWEQVRSLRGVLRTGKG